MVRAYKLEDSEGVKELILSILEKEYPFDRNAYANSDVYDISGTYNGERNSFFVCEENTKIVGTAGIKCDSEKTALLRRVFVDPQFRHKGIGTSLLKQSIEFCKKNDYKEIVFRATDRMKDAMKLIKKHGFEEQEKLAVSGFNIHKYIKHLS